MPIAKFYVNCRVLCRVNANCQVLCQVKKFARECQEIEGNGQNPGSSSTLFILPRGNFSSTVWQLARLNKTLTQYTY